MSFQTQEELGTGLEENDPMLPSPPLLELTEDPQFTYLSATKAGGVQNGVKLPFPEEVRETRLTP